MTTSLRTALCDDLGAALPIFGFTHSLDAAIAISRHGGVGIWGATRSTPDEIEAGYILTCQSHPKTDKLVVDYDG